MYAVLERLVVDEDEVLAAVAAYFYLLFRVGVATQAAEIGDLGLRRLRVLSGDYVAGRIDACERERGRYQGEQQKMGDQPDERLPGATCHCVSPFSRGFGTGK
jgi:hypothetical protein